MTAEPSPFAQAIRSALAKPVSERLYVEPNNGRQAIDGVRILSELKRAGVENPVVCGPMALRLHGMPYGEADGEQYGIRPDVLNVHIGPSASMAKIRYALIGLGVRRSANEHIRWPGLWTVPLNRVRWNDLEAVDDDISPFHGFLRHTEVVVTDAGPIKLDGYVYRRPLQEGEPFPPPHDDIPTDDFISFDVNSELTGVRIYSLEAELRDLEWASNPSGRNPAPLESEFDTYLEQVRALAAERSHLGLTPSDATLRPGSGGSLPKMDM